MSTSITMSAIELEVLKITLGFALTTVVGGCIAYLFQRSQARNQWLLSRWDREVTESREIFEEVSRLLDKRLYRTRQLIWSFGRPSDDVAVRMGDYRKVVTRWNDNLNRLLALLAIHFGDEIRVRLDSELGRQFVDIGRELEAQYKIGAASVNGALEEQCQELALAVYEFNLALLLEIRRKRTGFLSSRL